MFENGRRTAISSSELGLYSDRGDRYNRNRYNLVARKFAIGVMVVVAVILVAVFLYDFTSATSINSKISQETKHIYILQNALKKSNITRKLGLSNGSLEFKASDSMYMQDRSDDETYRNQEPPGQTVDPEVRSQNLKNFNLRNRVLKSKESNVDTQAAESKQLFDNHAIVYRVKQRYKPSGLEEDVSSEESRPTPFHWELKTPHPTSFKRTRYPQLSQYRYPHNSRNIQEIIKYLTNDPEIPNRGIKFAGVYVNPKKYNLLPEMGELMSNSDRSEEEQSAPYPITQNADPFYQYKPKHPADVNLLAMSNVRFSPSGLHRYSPYYDASLYTRPVLNYNKQPSSIEPQYENSGSYANHFEKKRKPKPFSVMLDIYPITDMMEQNKKYNRPWQQNPTEEFDPRRPLQFNRGPKYYSASPQSIPMLGVPSQQVSSDEDEKQQMIFHLNLYPRRKSKLNRYDVIHKSESMPSEERQQFMEKLMSPLETIAKHLAVEDLKHEDNENSDPTGLPITRYQETILDGVDGENSSSLQETDFSSQSTNSDDRILPASTNHKTIVDEDYASTEKYEYEAEKFVETTTQSEDKDSFTTAIIDEMNKKGTKSMNLSKDIDTVEGFQQFSDSLLNAG